MITIHDFNKLDFRVGTIIAIENFPEAREPAYKLTIDLGKEIGIKRSSAQITVNYSKEALMNKQVLCIINLVPRQIGPFISEVLTLGVPDNNNHTILVVPDKNITSGGKLY
jgi:tRNA-binding protein